MRRPTWIKQRRRHDAKITIMRRVAGRNAMNELVNDFEPVFTTRASAYPAPGFERSISDANVATMPMTFEVRDEARTRAILPTDKLRWDSNGNQMFNIVAPVEQPERGSDLRIIAAADRT